MKLVRSKGISEGYHPFHALKNGNSAINNLCIKHRHLQCNLLFTTQYMKAIPPVLRRNVDIFVIFKFAYAQSVE